MQAAKIKAVHVPYKGAAGSLGAVISGEAQFMFPPASTAIGQVRERLLTALAVTGEKRIASLPEVPTMGEAGLKNYVSTGWVGLMAPRGTPPAVLTRLRTALAQAAALPATRAQLDRLGAEAVTTAGESFDRFVRSEYAKYDVLTKLGDLQP
jgi:tripartite-type tricarboxylate transporter receptor subunit TctC